MDWLIAELWLSLGGTGRLHYRLWEESSEQRFVDGKAGSATQSALHAEQTQSEHAQKQRW